MLFIVGLLTSCLSSEQEKEYKGSVKIENPTNKVVLSSEVVWEKLNPARGTKARRQVQFGSTDRSIHTVSNNSEKEIILYVRTSGEIKIK